MTDHPPPNEALKWYRRKSPSFVNEQAEKFSELSPKDQAELLFYMSVHQANALGQIGQVVNIEVNEMTIEKDN